MDLIWIVAAFLAGLLAKALQLPTLVGYLLAGLALALFGVEANAFIDGVGDFGVVLLLFTVGLHINFTSLLQPQTLGVGTLHLIISSALFGGLLLLLGIPSQAAWLLAVGLSFSSTVLTAKALDSRDELDSYHGRLAIGILILQDLVAVLLLAVSGGELPGWEALGLFLLPLARPVLLRLMGWVGSEELLLVYGLLLALGAGWLFELVGLDAKLGALAIGLLLAGDARSNVLYEKLWALKEVFLIGFFLEVGLGGFPDGSGWLLIGVLLVLLPLKGAFFFFLMVLFRLRARTAFLGSVSLTAYSEFALIVAAGAASVGLIEPQLVVMVGLLVALSYIANAPISRYVNQLWERLSPRLVAFERPVRHPDHEPRSLGSADFVVLGMGRAGTAAYDRLIRAGKRPVGLDDDPAQLQQQLGAGRRVLYGDAKDPELWRELDISGVEGVLLTMRSRSAELAATHGLRGVGYTGFITALLQTDDHRAELEAAGVTVAFLPITQAGRELADVALAAEPAAE